MPQTIQMSLKRKRDEDDHEERDPYAAAERPGRWVLVWCEVVVERGDDVREEALDDDQVTGFCIRIRVQHSVLDEKQESKGE